MTIKALPQDYNYEQEFDKYKFGANLAPLKDFTDDVQAFLVDENKGIPFGWDSRLAFRDGEVTIWSAPNGSGKSLITGQVMLQLALFGIRSCVMSLEMSARRTIVRMMQQVFNRYPTVDDTVPFVQTFGSNLVFFDKVGATNPKEILGAVFYSATIMGCRHIFIDNLAKVVVAEDDMNAQKFFIQNCCDLARDLGIHIHIVTHVRKLTKETDEIGKYDIRGSSAITDQPDNVIILQRNVAKEQNPEDFDYTEPDATLRVVKQRNAVNQDQFSLNLWFNPSGKSFTRTQGKAQWLGKLSPQNSDASWWHIVKEQTKKGSTNDFQG